MFGDIHILLLLNVTDTYFNVAVVCIACINVWLPCLDNGVREGDREVILSVMNS